MADDKSSTEENPTHSGVVLNNPEMPSLGFMFNYCIYDGIINLKELLLAHKPEELSQEKWAEEKIRLRRVLPTPRSGGGAFAQAVKTLQTKKQMRVLEEPNKPLSTNKERSTTHQRWEVRLPCAMEYRCTYQKSRVRTSPHKARVLGF